MAAVSGSVAAAALFVVDESLRVCAWNEATEDLVGISAETAVGRRCWEVFRGSDLSGRVVCHRACPVARLARAGRTIPSRTLVLPADPPLRVAVDTIAIGGSAPGLVHIVRSSGDRRGNGRRTGKRAGLPDARDFGPPPRRTLDDVLAQLAPDRTWRDLISWPPDVFAITSAALSDSSAYRLVVSPMRHQWPPFPHAGRPWKEQMRAVGRAWAAVVAARTPERLATPPCDVLVEAVRTLEAADAISLAGFDDDASSWTVFVALVTLHAAADEACAGVLAPSRRNRPFEAEMTDLLTETGSLARLAVDRARVLPKLRVAPMGLTARSLSRHLCLDRSEVETRWHLRPPLASDGTLTILVVPYPGTVYPEDVRSVRGPLWAMDRSRSGFFEFEPHEELDHDELARLVRLAAAENGRIDALVLPECAVDSRALPRIRRRLEREPVDYLIAGVREAAPEGGLGANYAFVGRANAGGWAAAPQHKHHRWCVDASQIEQYGLDLDGDLRWWEAISVQRRTLTFVSLGDAVTICPLVCEDLARPDPVADVIRGVGPTLIVGLLLDGPQLASRWSARYATVLADDPGSSVLSVTALGMVERSRPPGFPPSRVVALWKDPLRGLREIELAEGSAGVVLTCASVSSVSSAGLVADGRDEILSTQLTLVAVDQVVSRPPNGATGMRSSTEA